MCHIKNIFCSQSWDAVLSLEVHIKVLNTCNPFPIDRKRYTYIYECLCHYFARFVQSQFFYKEIQGSVKSVWPRSVKKIIDDLSNKINWRLTCVFKTAATFLFVAIFVAEVLFPAGHIAPAAEALWRYYHEIIYTQIYKKNK